MFDPQRHDGIHVAGIAEQGRGDNGTRARTDFRFDRLGRDVEGVGVDVGEYRYRGLIQDRRNRTHVSDRCGDDLITGLRVDGRDRGMHSRRAGAHRLGELSAELRRSRFLELLDDRAEGAVERSRIHHLLQQAHFFVVERAAAGVPFGR